MFINYTGRSSANVFRLICFIFFFSISSIVKAEQLVIEPEMGRSPILNAIQDAHYSLNLVMYGFTDQAFLHALLKQKKQGIAVKILLEPHPYKREEQNNKIIEKLNDHHFAVKNQIPGIRLIHQKSLISDGRMAMIMTFNFTYSAFKQDRNFALILDDPKKVKQIQEMFMADWQGHPHHVASPEIIFSHDHSREKIYALLNTIKHSLDIYAQDINDYELIAKLAKLARHGVIVNILTSKPLTVKKSRFLQKAGVNIRFSRHYYIHAKVMIMDRQSALLGSINWTKASFEHNRELSIVTHDSKVLQALNATFHSDWESAMLLS